ncbi:unnamed protein product, partial [Tetraodon nigroviridis]
DWHLWEKAVKTSRAMFVPAEVLWVKPVLSRRILRCCVFKASRTGSTTGSWRCPSRGPTSGWTSTSSAPGTTARERLWRARAAEPHRHAAGLRGGDADLLRRRADAPARLPLRLHTGAVPRLLDRRGSQHHPVLHVSSPSRVQSPHRNWF